MDKDWLQEIKPRIPREQEFFTQMDAQLARSFEKSTAEPISDFLLIPPIGPNGPSKELKVMEGPDYTYLDADLLNIELVFAVRIAWKHGEEGYSFWWQTLPSQEIKKELISRRDIQFGVDFAFDINIRNPVWPHVKLILLTGPEFHADVVEERILDIIDEWNEDGERTGGVVHHAGRLTQLNEYSFSMAIDFGSTGLDFVTHLLKELEQFDITRVTLDS